MIVVIAMAKMHEKQQFQEDWGKSFGSGVGGQGGSGHQKQVFLFLGLSNPTFEKISILLLYLRHFLWVR